MGHSTFSLAKDGISDASAARSRSAGGIAAAGHPDTGATPNMRLTTSRPHSVPCEEGKPGGAMINSFDRTSILPARAR